MKKVSTDEKIFIISILSLLGGAGAAMAAKNVVEAGLIGLVTGILGAAVIGILHRSRS